ncbi:MAG: sigma-70 factor domain-containing protein, partial [Thermoguttaceae bacterium]
MDETSDPVQLYLTQMSGTPLMSRGEEVAAAQRIELSRTHLRRALLSSDYLLQAAAAMLDKVAQGKMRVEAVCEGSLSDSRQRDRLNALVGPNLRTLRDLLRRNRLDFSAAVSRGRSLEHRRRIRR